LRTLTWLVSALVVFLAHGASAAELTGRVVAIADGDTVTVLSAEHQQTKIRLAEIDAPETRQPYGSRAKQVLSALVFDKQVRVVVVTQDRYGRTVGRIYIDRLDVNAEMIRQGAAWVYCQYNHDPSLLPLEQAAQQAGVGLWALPEAERQPPWVWRASERARRAKPIEGGARWSWQLPAVVSSWSTSATVRRAAC